ncbi:MAG: hypothetical protein ACRYFA_12955 [Janthinobacterium lividum]
MKKLILFALTAFTLVSCKKADIGSSSFSDKATAYAPLNIKTTGQVVKMAVAGSVLNMVFNEDVTLILDSSKLAQNFDVHLKEDLSTTQLNYYHYHSVTKSGVKTTDWVDDNLDNIVLHSSKDTVINKQIFVIKRIIRSLIYQQNYSSAAEATKALNNLLKQTDILTFTSYYTPQESGVAVTANTAKLTYVQM